MSAVERKKIAQEDFDYWYGDAVKFLKGAVLYANDKDLNMAAFMLHQTAERTYNAAILVFTGYKPRTHNIGKLIRLSRGFSPELGGVFPANTKEESNLFNLLKKAYIGARYKKDYVITQEDLTELLKRIQHLQAITERICKEKIASLNASRG